MTVTCRGFRTLRHSLADLPSRFPPPRSLHDQWRADELHAVSPEQLAKRLDLLCLIRVVEDVIPRRQLSVRGSLADRSEERLHRSGGLVHVDDSGLPAGCTGPHVFRIARDEDALACRDDHAPALDLEVALAVEHVDPFVLLVVE